VGYVVGTVLALAVGIFARGTGLDRDRAFYPTVMIVIAFLYALFAFTAASTPAIVVESLIGSVFAALAVWGFRGSLWLVVLALAGHGVFDSFHAGVVSNPGVPVWWPPFCLTYDVAAAAFLAWLLRSGRVPAGALENSP
jgi:hypothetical protein